MRFGENNDPEAITNTATGGVWSVERLAADAWPVHVPECSAVAAQMNPTTANATFQASTPASEQTADVQASHAGAQDMDASAKQAANALLLPNGHLVALEQGLHDGCRVVTDVSGALL